MANRRIIAFKHYFSDFIDSVDSDVKKKVAYILDVLKTQDRIPARFVKHLKEGLYEIRIEFNSNIYRVFFVFDNGQIVVLFNGFQKKTQKTPKNEIDKALKIKEDYERTKGNS